MLKVSFLSKVNPRRAGTGLWAFFHVVFGILPTFAAAPALVGKWPDMPRMGAINSTCVATNLGGPGKTTLLIAAGVSGVHLVDYSKPPTATLLSVLDTGGEAQAVAMITNIAVVADGLGGLVSADVSNPSQPRKLGVLSVLQDPRVSILADVAVSGRYAFAADRFYGLQVAFIPTNAAPMYVTNLDTGSEVETVSVLTNRAYVSGPKGLWVFDITTPSAPRELGFFATSGTLLADCAVGNFGTSVYAYLLDRANGLSIVDITGISALRPARLVTAVSVPGIPNGIALKPPGYYALVAAGPAGMVAVDVSIPTAPVASQLSLSTGGDAWSITTAGTNIFVADRIGGLRIVSPVNISKPVPTDIRATLPISGRVRDVAASGTSAVIADGSRGVRWMGLTNPSLPVELANALTTNFDAVAISSESNFVAAGISSTNVAGVQLLQMVPASGVVTNKLVFRGRYLATNALFRINGIAQSGGLIYIAAGAAGLAIVDATTPDALVLRKLLPIQGSALGVAATNKLAYVASLNGLQIVDASVPASATVIGTNSLPGNTSTVLGVAIRRTNAFLASENRGVQVSDISNPRIPKLLSYLGRDNTPGTAWRVAIQGNLACVADGPSGLSVVDVSNPANPVLLWNMDTDGNARGIAIGNDHVLLADDSQLLVIAVDSITPTSNSPPSFVVSPNPILANEDAGSLVISNWVSQIQPGSFTSEAWQTVTLSLLNNSNTNLFSQLPSVRADGALLFRPATNASGAAAVTVRAVDNGGTTNGGVNETLFNAVIGVRPVNDPPIMDPTVALPWRRTAQGYEIPIQGLYPGPPDERATQVLTLTATCSPPGIFPNPTVVYAGGTNTTATLVFADPLDWGTRSRVSLAIRLVDSGVNDFGGTNVAVFTRLIAGSPIDDPPTVTILSPTDGTVLPPTTTDCALEISAVDENGPPVKLEVLVDGARVDVISNPTSTRVLWTLTHLTPGPHTVAVKGTDASGKVGTSDPVGIVIATSPTISVSLSGLSFPEDTVGGPIQVTVTPGVPATPWTPEVHSSAPNIVSAQGITTVISGSGYSVSLAPVTNAFGTFPIECSIVDEWGGRITQGVSVEITPVDDPSVTALQSPKDEEVLSENSIVALLAVATDIDSDIAGVDFLLDGEVIGSARPTLNTNSFSVSWSYPASGDHVLSVVATSVGSSLSVTSAPVRVHVTPAPNLAPVISLPTTVVMAEDSLGDPVTISVTDDRTAPSVLEVHARSLDPDIVPDSGLRLERLGDAWTLTIAPATNANGRASIEFSAGDSNGAWSTNILVVNVTPVDDLPTVALTLPADGTVYTDGSTVTLSATAADVDTPIDQVLFLSDGRPVGSDDTAPYECSWTPPSGGTYALSAVAVESAGGGLSLTSAPVQITVKSAPVNRPPSIVSTNPVQMVEDTPSSPVEISVTDDQTPAAQLVLEARTLTPDILPDGGMSLTRSNDLWSLVLTPSTNATGKAVVLLIASDTDNAWTTNVVVVDVAPVDDPPSIALAQPTNGAVFPFGASVTLAAAAADVDTPIDQVLFLSDGKRIGSANTAPYEWNWTPPSGGTYALSAVAVESAGGGLSLTSAPVQITVTATPVNRPPSIVSTNLVEMVEDTPSSPVEVSVTDDQTAAAQLVLEARTLTPDILPDGGMSLIRSNDVWNLILTPSANATGKAVVLLIAGDTDNAWTTNVVVVDVAPVDDPPSIALAQPTNGAVFPFGASVTLAAAAADIDSPIDRVEFFDDGARIGSIDVSPYVWTLISPAVGDHVLSAVLVESAGTGLSVTSAPVRVNVASPSNRAPSISSQAVANLVEDVAGEAVPITVTDDQTTADQLVVDARTLTPGVVPDRGLVLTHVGGDTWNLVISPATNANGQAVIYVIASDASRASTTNVVVVNIAPVNDAPTVSLTSPVDGTAFAPGLVVGLDAAGSDVEGPLAEVRFMADGLLVGTATTPPYHLAWSGVALGPHELTAVASDGSLTVTSAPVRITVTPPANKAPTIAGGGPITLYRDSVSSPIALTVADDRTGLDQLTLRVAASDPALFPSTNMVLGGSAAARTLTLVPAPGAFGNSVVEVRVSDKEGLSASVAFPVTVLPVSELPGGETCFSESVPLGYGTFNLLKHAGFLQMPGGVPLETEAASSIELRAPPRYSVLSAVVSGSTTFRESLVRRDDGVFAWTYSGNEQTLLSKLPFGPWNTTYKLNVQGSNSFSGFFPFTVISNVPPVPGLLNLDAGQSINAASAFALSWVPWSGSGTNDRVLLTIVDDADKVIVSAASDCSGQTPLQRRAAGLEIAARTLSPDTGYTGYLTFGATQLSVNDQSPLLMLRAYHSRTTRFGLRTAPAGSGMAARFGMARLFGGSLSVVMNGTPGMTYRVESSPDLCAWTLATVVTVVTIPSSGATEVVVPMDSGAARFFRAIVMY